MALDDDTIRLIEQLNPGVDFDWARLLKGQGQPVTEPRLPPEGRRQRDQREGRRSQPKPQQSSPAPAPPAPVVPKPIEEVTAPAVATSEPEVESAPRPDVPPEFLAPALDDSPTPAHAKLGDEGVRRLRGRYAEILRRIPERTSDPVRREELRQQAERLNPDSWTNDDAVVQGLEQYEAVLASLRELVGQKRRRRRRGNRHRSATEASSNGMDASASTEDGEGANGSTDDQEAGDDGPPEDES